MGCIFNCKKLNFSGIKRELSLYLCQAATLRSRI
nr:MAG TPA: hypothetical protein [Caudoviricetes sp.]